MQSFVESKKMLVLKPMIYCFMQSWMSLPYIFSQLQIVHDFSSFLSLGDLFYSFQFKMPFHLQMWPRKYGMLEDRNIREWKGKKEMQR